jgi:trehalose 6-phosphate phosphatase
MSRLGGGAQEAKCFIETRVAAAARRVLILDYDGTLAPFRAARNEARPYPGMVEALTALQAIGGTRLVLVSGRDLDSLVALLELRPFPEAWGAHGWEHLSRQGRRTAFPLPPTAAMGLAEADWWLRDQGLGAQAEPKHGCLALHWRGLSTGAKAELKAEALDAWRPLAARAGLVLEGFEQGLELRAPGRDKGMVVGSILAVEGPDSAVAYLGDDRTDEQAFAALHGRGLAVLVRRGYRSTLARVRLSPPEEVLWFFRAWAEASRVPVTVGTQR